MKKISFVIPCYKSEKTIEKVIEEIKEKMSTLSNDYQYEVILVNDCSPDDTWKVIRNLSEKYVFIKGINLAKNFGQHSATMAGFHYANGEIIVGLDDDGQTPADEVDKLLSKLEDGYDLVFASYGQKKHSLFRNLGSYVNDLMTRALLNKPADLFLSSYFCMKRFVVDEIMKYENPYPYLSGLFLRTTSNIANVPVNHRDRECGASGYNVRKLLSLWVNGFTAFSVKPLRLATYCGLVFSVIGFMYGLFIIIRKLLDVATPLGWSSTMAGMMFIGGLMLMMQGMTGEYIGRMYISMNKMPQYVVREVVLGAKENIEE